MITASVVTYNTNRIELDILLQSAVNSEIDIIFIIDNSNIDELRDFVVLYPKVRYFFGHGNIGYGSAHNMGIHKSLALHADYHIILNPDISFDPKVISELKIFMDENANVGLLMPKILYPNGELQYLCKLLPNPINLFLRRFLPIKSLISYVNRYYDLRHFDYNQILNVPCLSGCFMFIRSEVFGKIGFFDENIFMYAEDFDYSRRIHEHYKTCYYPYVSIIHAHKKASYKSFKMLSIHVKSIVYYFNKWGWFFDNKRDDYNNKVLNKIKHLNKYNNE